RPPHQCHVTVSSLQLTSLHPSLLSSPAPLLQLHSFPTRRSSDLSKSVRTSVNVASPIERLNASRNSSRSSTTASRSRFRSFENVDRKSTRLNSSHGSISYAVFCLKKKQSKDCVVRAETPGHRGDR